MKTLIVTFASILMLSSCSQQVESTEQTQPATSAPTTKPAEAANAAPDKPTIFDAYGMSCEFICKYTGWPHETNFKMDNEMSASAGENEWMIRGQAEYQGKSIVWTTDIKYDPATKLWNMVYKPAIMNGHL